MSAVAGFPAYAFLVSLGTDLIASIAYMAASNSRDSRSGFPRLPREQLRFEAVWGMVLAAPTLLAVFAIAADSQSRSLWIPPLLAGVAALYAIPALALMGHSLPAAARWYPAVVAIGALPVAVLVGVVLGYGAFWLIFFLPISTRLGFGYAADCMVAVRFARAVRPRDAECSFVPEHGFPSPVGVAER